MVAAKVTRAKLVAAHQLFMQHHLSWFAPEALKEETEVYKEKATEVRLLAILQATGMDGLAVMEMPTSLRKCMGTAVPEVHYTREATASAARPYLRILESRQGQ